MGCRPRQRGKGTHFCDMPPASPPIIIYRPRRNQEIPRRQSRPTACGHGKAGSDGQVKIPIYGVGNGGKSRFMALGKRKTPDLWRWESGKLPIYGVGKAANIPAEQRPKSLQPEKKTISTLPRLLLNVYICPQHSQILFFP